MADTPEKLSPPDVEARLKSLPEWGEAGEAIQRTYQFADFAAAMAFVTKVARQAEATQHHPDIMIRYNKVTLILSTHDAGGISAKDFEAAHRADEFAAGAEFTLPQPSAAPSADAPSTAGPSAPTSPGAASAASPTPRKRKPAPPADG